jgi:hypothetical protein
MKHFLTLLVLGLGALVAFPQGTTTTTRYQTVADMVAATVQNVPANSRLSALVTGRVTANDGGGGLFFFVPASVTATNLGTVFPSTGVAGRWFREYSGPLNVAWFGVIGDFNGSTGTDLTTKMQSVISAADALGNRAIQFNSQRYFFGSSIIITNSGFTFLGPSGNSFATSTNRPFYLTGAAGISIFNYGNGLATAGLDGITFRDMAFLGIASTTTSAIKTTIDNNQSSRPFIVQNCSFIGFSKALWFSPPTPGNISCSNLSVEDSVFFNNGVAVQADGVVLGMRFTGNLAEAGGQIAGTISGPVVIENNIFEGQANAITISSGLINARINNNYFEANTGNIVAVTPTNPASLVEMENNFVSGSTGRFYTDQSKVTYTNWKNTKNFTLGNSWQASLNGGSFYTGITNDFTTLGFLVANLNLTDALSKRSLNMVPSGGATYIPWGVTGTTWTPLGVMGYEAVSGLGTLKSIALSTVAKDVVTICVLARSTTTNLAEVGFVLTDSASVALASPTAATYLFGTDWEPIIVQVRLANASAVQASLKYRWNVTSGTAWFSDAFVYVQQQVNSLADPVLFEYVLPQTNAVQTLGTVTTVLHGNASGAPTYGAVTLTTDVTGTLPVANGGTGASTIAGAGIVTGSGTANYVTKWTAATTLSGTSLLYDNGTSLLIGETSGTSKLEIKDTSGNPFGLYIPLATDGAGSSITWYSDTTGVTKNPIAYISAVNDGSNVRRGRFYFQLSDDAAPSIMGYVDHSGQWFFGKDTLSGAKVGFDSSGNITLGTAGGGLKIKEGSNARMGQATLVNGTVTVSNTSVTASTRIFLTRAVNGGTTIGVLGVGTVVAATSFVIESSTLTAGVLSADDDSTVNWLLIEPSP